MKIAIFGCSGFASELADICDALDFKEIVYLSEGSAKGSRDGLSIFPEAMAYDLASQGYVFAIGVATPSVRKKIALNFPDLDYVNLIHPSATFGRLQRQILDSACGVVIAAGVRFMSGIAVMDFSVVSMNATIGHNSRLGKFSIVMPGSNVSGFVDVGNSAYIGTNATILQGSEDAYLELCDELIIGAGAVVTMSLNKPTTYVGVPAKELKLQR